MACGHPRAHEDGKMKIKSLIGLRVTSSEPGGALLDRMARRHPIAFIKQRASEET
jgi:hypothetical protein